MNTHSIDEIPTVAQLDPSAVTSAVHTVIDAWTCDRIVELLARRELCNPALVLADLDAAHVRQLRRRAALALASEDPTRNEAAIYCAADAGIAMRGAGPLLGSLPRTRRADHVHVALGMVRTYLKALAGEIPGALAAHTLLAEADAQAALADPTTDEEGR